MKKEATLSSLLTKREPKVHVGIKADGEKYELTKKKLKDKGVTVSDFFEACMVKFLAEK